MKSVDIIGIILIIAGVVLYNYSSLTYASNEKVAQVGSVKVTADTNKTVNFPPILGGLCLIGGVGLIVMGRFKD